MREKLDNKLISLKLRAMQQLNELLSEERGDTNFVAIIIIIVILIGVAAIFQDKLTQAVTGVFDKLLDFLGI